jgi:hypothetical protein
VSHPRRSFWLAGAGALTLALIVSGLALGRVDLKVDTAPATTLTEVTPAVDTTATFEDLNGNGIDDACEENVVADPTTADAALKAADLDGDGVLSVSEAARSGWTGGTNCNHGGYVSWVAHDSPEAPAATTVSSTDKAAAKAAKAAAKAAKDASKAAKEAARAARKAAREAAKAERKAAHAATKAARQASKPPR